jgi:hypothetical protein
MNNVDFRNAIPAFASEFDRPNVGLAFLRFQAPGEDGAVKYVSMRVRAPLGFNFGSPGSDSATFCIDLPWGIRAEAFLFPDLTHADRGQDITD